MTRLSDVTRLVCSAFSLGISLIFNSLAVAWAGIHMFLKHSSEKLDGSERSKGGMQSSTSCEFYEGKVTHVRQKPVHHEFTYPVRYVMLDLDSPPCWFDAKKVLLLQDVCFGVSYLGLTGIFLRTQLKFQSSARLGFPFVFERVYDRFHIDMLRAQ